jgi:hypothetical protein
MPRLRENLPSRADFNDPSIAHHRDTVGNFGDDAKIVRDEQNCVPVNRPQVADEREHLRLGSNIEGGCGLVRDEHFRIHGERHRNDHALTLPTGELVWVRRENPLRIGKLHRPHQDERTLPPLGRTHGGVQLEHLRDLLAHRHGRVQRRHGLLKDHGDPVAANATPGALGQPGQLLSLQPDATAHDFEPGCRRPHDRTRQGGLAGARLPDDAQNLATPQLQGGIVDRQ